MPDFFSRPDSFVLIGAQRGPPTVPAALPPPPPPCGPLTTATPFLGQVHINACLDGTAPSEVGGNGGDASADPGAAGAAGGTGVGGSSGAPSGRRREFARWFNPQ